MAYRFEVVEIIDEEIPEHLVESGNEKYIVPHRNRKARVKCFDGMELRKEVTLGYVSSCEIFNAILEKKDINLNEAVVTDFTIKHIHSQCGLLNEQIEIANFQAIKSIWIQTDKNTIDFSNITFYGDAVSFHAMETNAPLSFSGCTFRTKHIDLSCIKTDSSLLFDNAIITGEVIEVVFDESRMSGIRFCGTRFVQSKISFYDVIFNCSTVEFIKTDFGESSVVFNRLLLDDTIELFWSGITCKGQILFINTTFNIDVEFQFDECRNLSFQNDIINQSMRIDVKKLQDMNSFSLHQSINKGQIYLESKKLLDAIANSYIFVRAGEPEMLATSFTPANATSRQIEAQYILLKENFNNIGFYDYEDDCYYHYRVCHRKAKPKATRAMEFLFMDLTGKYGTSWLSVLLVMPIVIALFALIFWLLPSGSFHSHESFNDFIYLSGVTFFTIGFGDISPQSTVSRLLSILEGFIGMFYMSYFTICFARKTLR